MHWNRLVRFQAGDVGLLFCGEERADSGSNK
jgi:hypothetical protein